MEPTPYLRGPYKKRARCIRGHLFAGANLQINDGKLGRKQRTCITCRLERDKTRRTSPEMRAKGVRDAREWRERNPERALFHERKKALKRYGITTVEYEAMLEKQGGVCAVCKDKCVSGRRLAVDHDHNSGRVRGLLCGNCNQGLGRFRDDPERLLAALRYLA